MVVYTMTDYSARHHIPLPDNTALVRLNALTLKDAALMVMTDFEKIKVVTIEPDISIAQALEKMKDASVRSLLVVDDNEAIIGLVTSYDIQSEKSITIAETARLKHADISVEMVMTPKGELQVVDMMSLRDARISHIIATLNEIERQHILVVEHTDNDEIKLRGMFSMSQIRKQLGQQPGLDLMPAHTLAEVVHELA